MMNIKNICISLLFIIASYSVTAQKTFTLMDAIEYGISNNNEIKNGNLTLEDAEAQILENRALGLPKITGTLDYNFYPQVPKQALPPEFAQAFGLPPGESNEVSFLLKNNITAGIGANSLVFSGTYLTALKAARLFREYAQVDLTSKERTVRNSIMDAYLPSLLIQESIKTLDKNIINLEKILFETKEVYKAGFAEQLDVDRLELSLANLNSEKGNLERQNEVALNALKFSMNYPVEKEINVSDDIESLLVEATSEQLEGDIEFLNRAEMRVAEIGLELGKLDIERYERTLWPNLVAFGNYQYQYQGDKLSGGFWAPTFVLGAKLTVPIFDGFDKRSKVERAEIRQKQNINNKDFLANLIKLEVENSRKLYLSAKQTLDNQNKNLALAEKIYNSTKIKYKEGVGSSIEVSQAEQALYQTQQNRIQAMFELLKAKMDLEQAIGVRN